MILWHSLIHPAKEYWIDVINIMLVRPCVLRGRWSCVHTSHCSPLIPPNFQEQSAKKRMFEEEQDKKHRTCCWPPNRKKWKFFDSIFKNTDNPSSAWKFWASLGSSVKILSRNMNTTQLTIDITSDFLSTTKDNVAFFVEGKLLVCT